MSLRPRWSPAAATWALALGLVVVAGSALPTTGTGALHGSAPRWAAAVLAVGFAAVEALHLSVEFRRQAYSFTLAGIPLLLGLLFCPVWQVVVARLLGSLPVLLSQRQVRVKVVFNLAAYAAEAAAAGAVLLAVAPAHSGTVLDLAQGGLMYATLLGLDVVMSALVLMVIRLHAGRLDRGSASRMLLPATLSNAACLCFALVTVELLDSGTLGRVLLPVLVALIATAYRHYTVLSARHDALALVGAFVAADPGAADVRELLAARLADIRRALRAGRAGAVLPTLDGGSWLEVLIDEDDQLTVRSLDDDQVAALARHVQQEGAAVLLGQGSREPSHAAWLADLDAQDATAVPLLTGGGPSGVLFVLDRTSDRATFTAADTALLTTLAGHLGMALRSTKLLERLQHEATHDVLTGLPNRLLLAERLVAAIACADSPTAVLMLDLDGFKEVNDTFGHATGDALLEEIAARLTQLVPPGSTVARFGGDEFAVLLRGPAATGDVLLSVARGLSEIVARPVQLENTACTVTASVGVATCLMGVEPGDLLRRADSAMYAAKADGIEVRLWDEELDRGRAERLALLADLHLALTRDEISVLYQPKLDLRTNRLCGAEALVRWQHPRLGTLCPDAFIPLAEASGLIASLTHLVLGKALAQCRQWRDSGMELSVAVNLSARNVADPELPRQVAEALRVADLPSTALTLEITESSVMTDPATAVTLLGTLADSGVRLSLDDFGTGYSSLAYLQRLPVQEVKIDRSMVTGLLRDDAEGRASEALVRSILGLGEAFSLTVVAEGIEDAETLERLRELGCDVAQGYHIGRPQSGEEVYDLARRPRIAAVRPALHPTVPAQLALTRQTVPASSSTA